MKAPKIIITGANGFIGSFLLNFFSQKGFKVSAFVHHLPEKKLKGIKYILFNLGTEINELEFNGIDYLIHCAYMKYGAGNNANEINYSGTKRLLSLSKKFNIKKFVFLSSLSAHKDAKSNYGKNKYHIEGLFNLNNDLLLKPGLVLGNGGLFLNIVDLIKKNKIIPLIGGGNQPIQTIHIDDLADAIFFAVENNISGKYAFAEREPITMKIFYQEIAVRLKKKIIWIYFPFFLAELFLKISSVVRISLPISRENLLGMKQSKSYDISNAIKQFQLQPKDYRKSLKELLS